MKKLQLRRRRAIIYLKSGKKIKIYSDISLEHLLKTVADGSSLFLNLKKRGKKMYINKDDISIISECRI